MSRDDHNLPSLLASDHVTYVQHCRDLFSHTFFPLSDAEIRALEANGNSATDWQHVRKTSAHVTLQTSHIRQCSFHGKVVLGRFSTTLKHTIDGVPFPCGVYNSTLSHVVVLDDALVKNNFVLKNVLVDTQASIIQCGSVTGPDEKDTTTASGNGTLLHVGLETGGRNLRVVADLPFALGAAVVTRRQEREFLRTYEAFVDDYVARIQSPVAIVASNARVRGCSCVQGSFVGKYAVVWDSEVVRSTILSTEEERSVIKSKSIVRDSIVQWNSIVETLSVVERAFLCDTSHVERHGVVMSSVIGPNTSIAEGEVTSSFVGPFVGFHHQALLIASIWPKGKGNVGYGANVGSNHTLKAPDQELFPGEGVFFGLGCNVKFPSNFVKAPYSVIATAVNTLPQIVSMPFALINTPAHTNSLLSPAINEISPGWVLHSSAFTILRNEDKFRSRNKSKRTLIEAAIFRPEIVQYMKDARVQLYAVQGKAKLCLPSGEPVYTDEQAQGLGKNYTRETSRLAGIESYTFFIKLFALNALLNLVEGGQVSIDSTVASVDSSRYELATLAEEFDQKKNVHDCLDDLVLMMAKLAKMAADGKLRDEIRGQRIIPDYNDVHKPASEEPVILKAQRIADDVKHRVAALVARG